MAKTKPCVICGDLKKPGHPLYCQECWIVKQPIEVQVADAKAARARAESHGRTFARVASVTWPDGHRWCAGCQRFRRLQSFGRNATQCRPCASAASHAGMLKRTYDLEAADYQAMFTKQEGRCAICRSRQLMRRLAVHHDHVSGEVVALACKRCNHDLLGSAWDSPVILLRAYALQVGGWPAVQAVLDMESRNQQWNPAIDPLPPF